MSSTGSKSAATKTRKVRFVPITRSLSTGDKYDIAWRADPKERNVRLCTKKESEELWTSRQDEEFARKSVKFEKTFEINGTNCVIAFIFVNVIYITIKVLTGSVIGGKKRTYKNYGNRMIKNRT